MYRTFQSVLDLSVALFVLSKHSTKLTDAIPDRYSVSQVDDQEGGHEVRASPFSSLITSYQSVVEYTCSE